MKAIVFGASGGLATAVASRFLDRGWHVDLVSRQMKASSVRQQFGAALDEGRARLHLVASEYSEFDPAEHYDAACFMQALFKPRALVRMDEARIAAEVSVGLTSHMLLTRKLLAADPPQPREQRNYCYIGSTSAYAGFKNTSVYCAVKHGLLGFVRAMNDEYHDTNTRFWLFSMGTMNTEMGAALVEQDPASFLAPGDVADRILSSIDTASNLFEPEVIMRRRMIRFREVK